MRLRRSVTIVGGLLLLGLSMIGGWMLAWSWHPSHRYRFQGVDVSAANGPIDWWAVRNGGADFAYVRATSGGDARDPRFEENWVAVIETGMRRGAMHRYSLCRPAADQANDFNTTVPRSADALPAAVELEFTADCSARPAGVVVLDDLRRFLTMVEAHTGTPVLLKVSKPFDAAYGVTAAIRRPIWAVQDFLLPTYPARGWRIWQANGMRRVDGVQGPVHWDVVAP